MSYDAKFFAITFPVPHSFEHRSYQYLQLSNGILAMLITDPSEDVASCSLSVATGHYADPDEVPGLAHLCEHMVCVSSKEYPETDRYRRLIHEAGGSFNAVTVSEKTSFYFNIPIASVAGSTDRAESAFEQILDVFSANFKSPLFDANYSNREIFSIDNEHSSNCTKGNRIAFQGYKLLANTGHQFSRFSTGNLESLTESSKHFDIQRKLQGFFKQEYLPSKMCLVLRGPQTLNYLQKIAISKFSTIGLHKEGSIFGSPRLKSHPSLMNKLSDFNIVENEWMTRYSTEAFSQTELSRAILVEMASCCPILRLAFPISIKSLSFLSKKQILIFEDFWCELFGSETAGTINSVLSSHDYISTSLSKVSKISCDTNLLELELQITIEGLKNISVILRIIFDFISLFQLPTSKFSKHLAKSMSQYSGVDIYNFLHSEPDTEPSLENRRLSEQLLDDLSSYSQWFCKGSYSFDFSDAGFSGAYPESETAKNWWLNESHLFCKFMQTCIIPSNMLISVVSEFDKIHTESWILDLKKNRDFNFGFDYKIGAVNISMLTPRTELGWELSLPPPNPFAPDIVNNQTQLLKLVLETADKSTNASLGYSIKNNSALNLPKVIFSDSGCQLWLKSETDKVFNDKVFLTMELTNTKIVADPKNVIVLEILCELVKSKISKYLYPALIVNFCYDLFPSLKGDSGLVIHVSGPKSHIYNVVTVIMYEVKLISDNLKKTVSLKNFSKAKAMVQTKYDSGKKLPSYVLSGLGLMAVIEENTWLLDQRCDALSNMDMNIMEPLTSSFFDNCYLCCFLHGDTDALGYKNEIIPVLQKLIKHFNGETHQFPSSISLPKGSNYTISSHTNDATNALTYFVQTSDRDDLRGRTYTNFLAFVLSTSLMNKLRSEYQLGYIVFIGLRIMRKTVGIHVTIVSNNYSAEILDQKVDDIIMEWFDQFTKKTKQANFRAQYVDKFITYYSSINQSVGDLGGSSSLTLDSVGSMGANRKIMKQHNGYWDQIVNKSFKFSKNLSGDDFIDIEIIKSMDLKDFVEFVKTAVLPISVNRSKIAILLNTNCSKEEAGKENKMVQTYCYLTSMGLPIKRDALEEIVEASGGSQVALGKNLFKHFRNQGKSIILITGVLAKMSKYLLMSYGGSNTILYDRPVAMDIDIHHIQQWQTKIGFVKEKLTMAQKLIQNV